MFRELAFFFPDFHKKKKTSQSKAIRVQRTLALIRPDALRKYKGNDTVCHVVYFTLISNYTLVPISICLMTICRCVNSNCSYDVLDLYFSIHTSQLHLLESWIILILRMKCSKSIDMSMDTRVLTNPSTRTSTHYINELYWVVSTLCWFSWQDKEGETYDLSGGLIEYWALCMLRYCILSSTVINDLSKIERCAKCCCNKKWIDKLS